MRYHQPKTDPNKPYVWLDGPNGKVITEEESIRLDQESNKAPKEEKTEEVSPETSPDEIAQEPENKTPNFPKSGKKSK